MELRVRRHPLDIGIGAIGDQHVVLCDQILFGEFARRIVCDLRAASIAEDKPPEVQLVSYGPAGITYRVKYWVPQHDREPACRDEVLGLIDAALRERGVVLAQPLVGAACAPPTPAPDQAGHLAG